MKKPVKPIKPAKRRKPQKAATAPEEPAPAPAPDTEVPFDWYQQWPDPRPYISDRDVKRIQDQAKKDQAEQARTARAAGYDASKEEQALRDAIRAEAAVAGLSLPLQHRHQGARAFYKSVNARLKKQGLPEVPGHVIARRLKSLS